MTTATEPGRRRLLVAAALSTLLVAQLLLGDVLVGLDIGRLSVLATLLLALVLPLVARLSQPGPWSGGTVYCLLFGIFHFGYLVLVALHLPFADNDADYAALWFFGPWVQKAIHLCMLALTAFAAAYAWVAVGSGRRPDDDVRRAPTSAGPEVAVVGAATCAAGVLVYLGYIALEAPHLLTGGNYEQYNDTVGGTAVLATALLLITYGVVLTAAAPSCRSRQVGLLVFAGYALVVLPLGVRTAVLFPAAAAAVAAGRTHRMPRPRSVVVLVLLVLTVISVVRDVRLVGVSTATVQAASFNPLSALGELGQTLRPVALTVDWRDAYGEAAYGGITYVAPVLRVGERLAGLPRPPGASDPRLASTVVSSRVSTFQIGYSSAAEAYLNFGTAGVVGVFLLLGALFSGLDRFRLASPAVAALAGVLMASQGLAVRNASNSVFVQVVAGALIVGAAVAVSRWRGARSAPPTRSRAGGVVPAGRSSTGEREHLVPAQPRRPAGRAGAHALEPREHRREGHGRER